MIRGRFGDTTGRPYIEGRLIVPRLNLRSDVSFIVDTGADNSLLMPLDGSSICSPAPDIMNIPSLLGRDILDRWRMTYNPSKRYLAFKVLSADYTVPIAPTQLT